MADGSIQVPVKLVPPHLHQGRSNRSYLRSFAAWCGQQICDSLTDPRSIAAVDVGQRRAVGMATSSEPYRARTEALLAYLEAIDLGKDEMAFTGDAFHVTSENLAAAAYGAFLLCDLFMQYGELITMFNAMCVGYTPWQMNNRQLATSREIRL